MTSNDIDGENRSVKVKYNQNTHRCSIRCVSGAKDFYFITIVTFQGSVDQFLFKGGNSTQGPKWCLNFI